MREGREETLLHDDLLKLAKFYLTLNWAYTTIIDRILQLESAQAIVEFSLNFDKILLRRFSVLQPHPLLRSVPWQLS